MRDYEDFEIIEAITSGGTRPYVIDKNLDFVPWAKARIDDLASRNRSRRTLDNNAQALRHLAAYMKYSRLKSLTDFDDRSDLLFGFREWLRNPYSDQADNVAVILQPDKGGHPKKRQDSTVNVYVGCISALLRNAYIQGILKKDPIPYTRRPVSPSRRATYSIVASTEERLREVNGLTLEIPREPPKVLSKKRREAALAACRQPRDSAILVTLMEGGFRAGELLGMRVEDVDFAQSGIHVVRRLDNPNGALAKGEDRFVDMPKEVMALLHEYLSKDWLSSRPKTDMLWVVVADPMNVRNGEAMDKDTLRSLFGAIGRRAKFGIHPHMLRHTHITDLVRDYRRRGEPIDWKFIADRVGHENVAETMQTYSHLSPEDHKSEYERLRSRRAQGRST